MITRILLEVIIGMAVRSIVNALVSTWGDHS